MKIEAICDNDPRNEYLVRCSHSEVMALGGTSFKCGEYLGVHDAIDTLERALTQLRWATRAIEAAP